MEIKIKEDYFTKVYNKRKPRLAMCKVSVVLFAFTLFSLFFAVGAAYISPSFVALSQNALVRIISFFGVSGQVAMAAAKMFVTSSAANSFLNMITVVFTVALPAFLFSKMVNVRHGQDFQMGGKCIKGFVFLFCITQLLCSTVLVFASGISEFLIPGAEQLQNVIADDSQFNIFGFVMQIICICIVVPLCEEYAFRGVVFGYLKRYGLSFAVIASAFVFGISHASPSQAVYAFMFGVVAGLVTALTGNMKTAVVLHMLNNLTLVVQENIEFLLDETLENIFYCIFLLFVFGFAFYGIYRFVKQGGIQDMYNEAKEQNDKELSYIPGIKDIFVFPVVVYIFIYAVSFLVKILG